MPTPAYSLASWRAYGGAILIVALTTALNAALSRWLSLTDLAMIYLLSVVIIAAYCPLATSGVGAMLSFAAFDFVFVPPVYTWRFDKDEHFMTALVLLAVGVFTSVLAARMRKTMAAATAAAVLASDEKLRNSLLASLSHDLRTPLSIIAGSASTLRENRARLTADEQDQLLAVIFEQSRTMSRDVSDLLEMTRLHAGPVRLNRQWYPLEELIGAALARCKLQLAGHRLSIDIPSDTPMVEVDGVLLEKLLVNLLENAAKYTPPGSQVHISVTHSSRAIDVSIEDDGPGLPVGLELQLFEKFARAQTEGPVPGSGLGLSICRAIAQLHDMTLTAGNRPERGARFQLSIPYRAPPKADAETE